MNQKTFFPSLSYSFHPVRLLTTFLAWIAFIYAYIVFSGAWLSEFPLNPLFWISNKDGYLLIASFWLSLFLFVLLLFFWPALVFSPLQQSYRSSLKQLLVIVVCACSLTFLFSLWNWWGFLFIEPIGPNHTAGVEIDLEGAISRSSSSEDWGDNALLNVVLVLVPVTALIFPQFFLRQLSLPNNSRKSDFQISDPVKKTMMLGIIAFIGNLLLMGILGYTLDPKQSFYLRILIYLLEGAVGSYFVITRRQGIAIGIGYFFTESQE